MEPSARLLWRLFAEAMVTYFRRDGDWEARLTATSALVVTGEPRADMNLMSIDDSPDASAHICEYVEVLRSRGLPFSAFITDDASERVGPVIAGLGLSPAATVPLMTWRPAAIVLPTRDYAVEVIDDEVGLRAASRVLSSAFGSSGSEQSLPPMALTLAAQGVTRFLGRLDGVPVCAASTTRAGAIAGIWSMGTAIQYQGRGAGRAILEHAVAYEQQRGAEVFFLGATPEGRPLYEKVGFREIASATLWVSTPAGGKASRIQ